MQENTLKSEGVVKIFQLDIVDLRFCKITLLSLTTNEHGNFIAVMVLAWFVINDYHGRTNKGLTG